MIELLQVKTALATINSYTDMSTADILAKQLMLTCNLQFPCTNKETEVEKNIKQVDMVAMATYVKDGKMWVYTDGITGITLRCVLKDVNRDKSTFLHVDSATMVIQHIHKSNGEPISVAIPPVSAIEMYPSIEGYCRDKTDDIILLPFKA